MEKLLFLDFDGVVSNLTWLDRHHLWKTFSLDAMHRVKEIIDVTSAKIVLCSVWRHTLLSPWEDATKDFFASGLDFFAITPEFHPFPNPIFLKENGRIASFHIEQNPNYWVSRAQEIQAFIEFYETYKRTKLTAWCVLDDEVEYYMNDWKIDHYFDGHLVLTTETLRVAETHKHAVIKILWIKDDLT